MNTKKNIIRFFFIFSFTFISHTVVAETQLESMEKMLADPAYPETTKALIRANIDKIRAYDTAMRTKTTFKSGGEWHAHFEYTWKNMQDSMEEDFEKMEQAWRLSSDLLDNRIDKNNKELNMKYYTKLLESNRFPKTVIDSEDINNAKGFHLQVSEILANHGWQRVYQYKDEAKGEDEFKFPVAPIYVIKEKENVIFLLLEVANYFKEARKIKLNQIILKDVLRKKRNTEMEAYVKRLKRPSAPPVEKKFYRNYGFYGNYHRDYVGMTGKLDSITFAKNFQESYFPAMQKAAMAMVIADSKIEEMEFNKVKSKTMLLFESDSAKKNLISLESFFNSYRRKTLDMHIADAKRLAPHHIKDPLSELQSSSDRLAREKYRTWSDTFVKTNFTSINMTKNVKRSFKRTSKQVAAGIVARMEHWDGYFDKGY